MEWSPANLPKFFSRGIIGFDYRAGPQFIPARSDVQYVGTWFDPRNLRFTADQFVWPRFWSQKDQNCFNRWGLADDVQDLNNGVEFGSPDSQQASIMAAFDMPTSWIDWREQGTIPTQIDAIVGSFNFSGFDIVDPWFVDGSALYSFNWEMEEMNAIMEDVEFNINWCGLISDEAQAIRAAIFFTEKLTSPNHRVFSPCGVWTIGEAERA